jgi:hypothetical protein
MSSFFSISESVRVKIANGSPAIATKFELSDIKIAAIQVINSLLKLQHLSENMAGGESIPDGMFLAEYDNIPVEQYKNVSRATLPIMPVKLPLNMGIFHVGESDDPISGFVPFEPGQLSMIAEEPLLSDILGQVGYEPRGKYLIFNSDITSEITHVMMLLVVKDMSLYNDFELLPIPADMEGLVIDQTFDYLVGKLSSQTKKVDVVNKEQ